MAEDEELERIRQEKVRKLMREASHQNFPDTLITLTDANFEEVVNRYPLVVVDFWAPWCPPCRMLAPTIEELAKEYKGRVVFGKLNVDENSNTAMAFGIMSIPTLLIMKDGREVDRVVGAVPKRYIAERLNAHIRK